jgi:hypothetical protein
MAFRADANSEYLSRTTGGFYQPQTFSACFWLIHDVNRGVRGAGWGLFAGPPDSVYVIFYNQASDGTTYLWEQCDGTNVLNGGSIAMTVGTWYFVGITRNGTGTNSAQFYYAAAADTAFTIDQATFSLGAFTPFAEVALSNNFDLTAGWVNGRMAGLKQWDTVALTADEMWSERQQFLPARTANLYSFHPMVGSTNASAAIDYGGSARNFTVTGALTIQGGPPIPWRQGRRRARFPAAAAPPPAITAYPAALLPCM